MEQIVTAINKIDEKLDKIHEKLDKFDIRLNDINVIQAVMQKDVAYHIKRTDLLEGNLLPIQKKYQMMLGVIKFVGLLMAASGALEAIVHLYYHY